MAKFFNYKDIDFSIEGETFYADQISLSVQASIEPVVLSDGTLLNYAPQGAVVGNLSCSFYLTGALPSFLNVTSTDESSVTVVFAGVNLNKVFLRQISFSVEPFQPILISAEFDWYGDVLFQDFQEQPQRDRFSKAIPNYIAHAHKSYLDKEGFFSNDSSDSVNNIVSFSYQASCDRPVFLKVDEIVPFRAAKLNKNVSIDLSASDLGKMVNVDGKKISTTIYVKDFSNSSLTSFSVDGVMTSQSYNISNGGYLLGEASVEQTVTEQKVLV